MVMTPDFQSGEDGFESRTLYMALIKVTYFNCGHRTVWGKIGKHAEVVNNAGDVGFCPRCQKKQFVSKTVRENS